eukprot:scaffold193229_cov31-Tisochrysis_lutea.AAC.3
MIPSYLQQSAGALCALVLTTRVLGDGRRLLWLVREGTGRQAGRGLHAARSQRVDREHARPEHDAAQVEEEVRDKDSPLLLLGRDKGGEVGQLVVLELGVGGRGQLFLLRHRVPSAQPPEEEGRESVK